MRIMEQVDEYLEGEFRNAAHPKDEYTIWDLRDPEVRRVIVFLNPIFDLDKPKRVVSLWASTFID